MHFDNKGWNYTYTRFTKKKTWNPPCFNIKKKLVGFGFQQANNDALPSPKLVPSWD
jgi:hypothetical protein